PVPSHASQMLSSANPSSMSVPGSNTGSSHSDLHLGHKCITCPSVRPQTFPQSHLSWHSGITCAPEESPRSSFAHRTRHLLAPHHDGLKGRTVKAVLLPQFRTHSLRIVQIPVPAKNALHPVVARCV